MKKIISYSIILMLLMIIAFEKSYSIPAFGRKYTMSCQTCHSPFPRLKPYGDEFAGNGFVLSDKEAPRYFLETGDPELKLIREIPLAFRLDGHITYNNENKKSDFAAPWLLKILSGGAIFDNVSYYFYFYLSEQGKIAGVEDAYLMFNNLFGIDIDLYLGQFQVSDPLFKRELRLMLEDYMIYKFKPELSKGNLGYDRGIMLTLGLETGTDISFEILNGCGLNSADESKIFDIDKHKTFFGRISQEIGSFLRIGGFGYWGKEDLRNKLNSTATNEIIMFGPDATLTLNDIVEVNVQYVQRKDIGLISTDTNLTKDITTKGGFAEIIFTPNGDDSKFYTAALFNFIDSEEEAYNYKTLSLHCGYLLARNLRLVGEVTYNFTHKDNKYLKFSLGFVSAF